MKTNGTHIIRPNVSGDIEILKCFARYPLLTINDVAALVGRSYTAVAARTNKLKANKFLEVARAQREHSRMYYWSCEALQLAPAAISKLSDIGVEAFPNKSDRHFIHTLTQFQTAASFEIGARQAGLKLHLFSSAGKMIVNDHAVYPDGGPIGIGYPDDTWRFVVFETDCASEPLTSSNKDRQAIERKLQSYLAILGQGLYETEWGIPNLHILFTSTTKTRVENMRSLLASMTVDYLRAFTFTVFGTIVSDTKQPDQKGWAVRACGFA
jgi:hypothetical protein